MHSYESGTPSFLAAQAYYAAGLNPIPVACNGSKQPPSGFLWSEYQTARPAWERIAGYWSGPGRPHGIALLCGQAAAGQEVIDFDIEAETIFPDFRAKVDFAMPGLLSRCAISRTPKPGFHVHYRSPVIEGSRKLAMTPNPDWVPGNGKPKVLTLVETKGHGGYVIAPGSPVSVHPTRRPYVLLSGDLSNLPVITADQRRLLHRIAETYNRVSVEPKPTRQVVSRPQRMQTEPRPVADIGHDGIDLEGERPGDAYNREADWFDILEPVGWRMVRSRGAVCDWCRPDKSGGVSATTNHAGSDLLYVFSTNAYPFDIGRGYSKFSAYALLRHDGDFSAAAADLAGQGYGQPSFPDVTNLMETL